MKVKMNDKELIYLKSVNIDIPTDGEISDEMAEKIVEAAEQNMQNPSQVVVNLMDDIITKITTNKDW